MHILCAYLSIAAGVVAAGLWFRSDQGAHGPHGAHRGLYRGSSGNVARVARNCRCVAEALKIELEELDKFVFELMLVRVQGAQPNDPLAQSACI